MQAEIRKIVVVGGGTAGWISAALLAAGHRGSGARGIEVTLVESPDIPTIGVGEGTWPSMRMTLQKIGISEAELVAGCDASFKQGTEFIDWTAVGGPHYYHPFSFPAEYSSVKLANYWFERAAQLSFAEFVTPQAAVISAGLAPKQASTPEYAFNVNYGYHFDAGRFAAMLHAHAVDRLGASYVSANVDHVETKPDGDIVAVVLDTGEKVEGDLFVDCTGQRSLLIGQHFGVELVPVGDCLFNDTAIAVQVPYARADDPIASVTRATAVDSGWIWDIGLQTRRGIGHVYSSQYSDEARAMARIGDYVRKTAPGIAADDLVFRTIPFEAGYRRRFWVNNCVAVGLSGGFVEPLEASALALIEQAAIIISEQLPVDREIMSVVAKRFNDKMLYHWERVIEFLKLHYVLSERDDSAYWRDHRDPGSCPDGLRDKLTLWQQQPPWHDDAPRVDELFPSASYQYVLYGMGFRPRYTDGAGARGAAESDHVAGMLQANRQKARQMLGGLPTNRELVSAMSSLRGVA